MSLKAFHFFFICVAILFAAYFGGWCLQDYNYTHSRLFFSMGVGSFVAAVALVVYLVWFLKKSRNISFLAIAFLALGLVSQNSYACAVCFGNPASPLVKAANVGVWFLMVVVGSVLMSFASLFLYWGHRARKLGM